MIPELFLICTAWGLFCAVVANVRAKRPVTLGLLFTITGFMTAELARFHMVLQVVASAVWIAFGALDEPVGWWGLSFVGTSLVLLELAHQRGRRAGRVVREAFVGHGLDLPDYEPPRERLVRPFSHHRPGISVERDLPYADGVHVRHRFDLFRPDEAEGAPIMFQIHGGGWVSGRKDQQGQVLLAEAAAQGWIGVAINYPLGPKTRFPDILIDVKRAIAHVKEAAPEWGGDPAKFVVTGGSAGGHLTALTALTADDKRWQPGFEGADCSMSGAVPFYGVYDFTDRHGHRGRGAMTPFLERMVMGSKLRDDRDGWDDMSPIAKVRPDAPPMFIIGCRQDTLVPIEETREFVAAMRATADIEPLYLELPHAHHAFDVVGSPRTFHVVHAVTTWANRVVAGAHRADLSEG